MVRWANSRVNVRLVLRGGLTFVALGLLAGVGAALGLTRFLSSLIYGATPTDPFTFASVIAALALTAVVACAVPARRATGVDPVIALRAK